MWMVHLLNGVILYRVNLYKMEEANGNELSSASNFRQDIAECSQKSLLICFCFCFRSCSIQLVKRGNNLKRSREELR